MDTGNHKLISDMPITQAINVECLDVSGERDCIVGSVTELVIIINGKVTVCADDGCYMLRSGQLFVRNPYQDYHIEKSDKLTLYRLKFNMNLITESFPEVSRMEGYRIFFVLMPHYGLKSYYNTHFRLSPSAIEYVRSLVNGMLSEKERCPEAYEAVIRCLLINMIVFLCREIVHANIPGESNLHEIATAISYIEKNFTNPITLEQLSNIASLSPRHFDRVFKRIYGISPFEYVLKLRMSYACDLLRDETLSIGNVAGKCGFSDSNYFTRCFKREFGCSPRLLRKSLITESSNSFDRLSL